MKVTITESPGVTRITKHLFVDDQPEEDLNEDYRSLIRSLECCAKGNCSNCIFCGYSFDGAPLTCDQNLMWIAAQQFRKLTHNEE